MKYFWMKELPEKAEVVVELSKICQLYVVEIMIQIMLMIALFLGNQIFPSKCWKTEQIFQVHTKIFVKGI